MDFDSLYKKVRRRAPASLDVDAMATRCRARNQALVADWRRRFPDLNSAVLEIAVHASGQSRRRLRRYREFMDFKSGTPGILVLRRLTMFDDILDFTVIEIVAAAARADIEQVEWRFLTAAEALADSAPP